jgi:AcrR family transcriptional regulator
MSSEIDKRPYRLKARAEAQDQTRLRITKSAVALHGSIGPARTSMSAVAEHAGVRRSTLYRHFPDEAALFGACSAHWQADHPVPDLAGWAAVADPDERLTRALTELYTYYGRGEQMLANLIRDAELVPSMGDEFGRFAEYFDAARDVLLTGRRLRGRARIRVQGAIGHATSFSTWRSLVREGGLRDAEAIALMAGTVHAAATG